MTMQCILCREPATSNEHLWPALFGGMRTNPNIYCREHNNALGPYVAELQKFLALFNAQLDVLPDGRENPAPALMTSIGVGSELLASGSELYPHVDVSELIGNLQPGRAELPLTSAEQQKRFMHQANKAGWKVHVVGKTQRQEYNHGPLHVRLEFGKDESFRGGAYLALTFFAHYFPLQARAEGMAEAKLMLRAGDTYGGKDRIDDGSHRDFDRFAWWTPANENLLKRNPFEFGHTVAVCQLEGTAYGYVSFFGVVNYGFRLGEALPGDDVAAVTYIDPLQRRQPNEWHEERGVQFCFKPLPEPLDVRSEVFGARMVERLSTLLGRILDRQQSLRNEAFVDTVNAERAIGETAVAAVVRREVTSRRQEIFNLVLRMAANPLELPLEVKRFLAACATRDETSIDGLTKEGRAVMSAVLDTLIRVICREANLRPLETRYVGDLLHGEGGQRTVAIAVLSHFQQ